MEKKKNKKVGEFLEAETVAKNVLLQDKKDDHKALDAYLIKAIEGVLD